MLENLYEFKKELRGRGISFCFSGPVSQELLVEIGTTLRHKMELEDTGSSTVLKVFSILVEQTQNMIHYSAEKTPVNPSENFVSSGIIVVGCENEHYYVLCGNMIYNEEVGKIRDKLVKLQQMNREELKNYYKEQRRKTPPDGSKGAGLGFIELARKAAKPLEFSFQQIDANRSFFSLKAEI
ncbi:MAG: hypothetical protein BWK79_02125 [Beggiatoa sp. IS2]|nr:MAG: hypothetical protein BWK79_02125 [Beggiatoa sp. IS2]